MSKYRELLTVRADMTLLTCSTKDMAIFPLKSITVQTISKTPAWLSGLTCLYGAILIALTVLNGYGPDHWWFGNLNLFLPQAIWLIPGILLTSLSLLFSRKWVWAPALCIIWVLGPIMGFCWRLDSTLESSEAKHFRVMACNVKNGQRDISALVDDITVNVPDIVILQDANLDMLIKSLGKLFAQWNIRYRPDGKYIVASKFPLGEVDIRTVPYRGELHSFLRCKVYIGYIAVALYDVHFESPRTGLYEFTETLSHSESKQKAIFKMRENFENRLTQARVLRDMVRLEQGPVIVAGDLNSSNDSLVCKTLRDAGLHDSFVEGGRGYGYTYGHYLLRNKYPWFALSWMRIDHIMISSHLESRHCWTGSGQASDHRPIFTDLIFKQKL